MGDKPSVTVVIPTCRRPHRLADCLAAVLGQRFAEPFEVLVVDYGHDDRTRALVEALAPTEQPAVRYLRPPRPSAASARNHGWRSSHAAVIAYTDDDALPARDWLAQGLQALRGNGHAAMCGGVVAPAEPAAADHELATLGLEWAEFDTANGFVRRDALSRVGGFDERRIGGWSDESDLQSRLLRAELSVGRCGDAVVRLPSRSEPFVCCLRQQRNAFFDALLYKKHPRLYRERLRRQPPWSNYAIVGLTLATPLLALDGLRNAAATAAALAIMLVLRLAWQQLKEAPRQKSGAVRSALLTSALIPFVSVYWRLRGVWRFRTLFH